MRIVKDLINKLYRPIITLALIGPMNTCRYTALPSPTKEATKKSEKTIVKVVESCIEGDGPYGEARRISICQDSHRVEFDAIPYCLDGKRGLLAHPESDWIYEDCSASGGRCVNGDCVYLK